MINLVANKSKLGFVVKAAEVAKARPKKIAGKLRELDPVAIRVVTMLIVLGILLVVPAGSALAQGGDEINVILPGLDYGWQVPPAGGTRSSNTLVSTSAT